MMDEATAREKYWGAVYLLNELIEAGAEDREELLESLENDLSE